MPFEHMTNAQLLMEAISSLHQLYDIPGRDNFVDGSNIRRILVEIQQELKSANSRDLGAYNATDEVIPSNRLLRSIDLD